MGCHWKSSPFLSFSSHSLDPNEVLVQGPVCIVFFPFLFWLGGLYILGGVSHGKVALK